jgi:predicted outer membrane protein
VEWLKNEDVKGFAKAMKEAEKQKFIRSMENVVSESAFTYML